jgi:hypothetical protein
MPSGASVLVGFCLLPGCGLCNSRKNTVMVGPARRIRVRFTTVDRCKHLSLDALVRVGGGCFLVGKTWIAAPRVRETARYTPIPLWLTSLPRTKVAH